MSFSGTTSAGWRERQILIQKEFFRVLTEDKHIPSQTEIARRLNLSINTIQRHYAEFDFEQMLDDCKMYSEAVLQATAQAAISGTHADRRLYYEVVHKFQRRVELSIKDPEELSPEDRRKEIKSLMAELLIGQEGFKMDMVKILEGALEHAESKEIA